MADYYIENDELKAGINIHGAELRSLVRKSDGREYMWSADPKYWNRVSPVLFPIVGALAGKTYRFDGREYTGIGQHGFARDCDFELAEKNNDSIWFELKANEGTKKDYPFEFSLQLGYELEGCKLHVKWKVVNTNNKEMYFSIGAHPAFICGGLDDSTDPKLGHSLDMNVKCDSFNIGRINGDGVRVRGYETVAANDGAIEIKEGFFDKGVLIFDSEDIHEVTMLDENKSPYLSVKFDTPQLGIWAPKGNAPFVCIEPWYGRCDMEDFAGSLEDREYGNSLEAGETLNKEYIIEVL